MRERPIHQHHRSFEVATLHAENAHGFDHRAGHGAPRAEHFDSAQAKGPALPAGPVVVPNPARRSELCGEPLQAHDLHQLAHFVFLLLAQRHDQRDRGALQLLHFGAIGVDRGELAT
jgi:hypothetical protein